MDQISTSWEQDKFYRWPQGYRDTHKGLTMYGSWIHTSDRFSSDARRSLSAGSLVSTPGSWERDNRSGQQERMLKLIIGEFQ